MSTKKLTITLIAFLMTLTPGFSQNDIVDTAAKAGKFKILLTAATEAGLAGVLKSKGPFTVFAPTDEAFGKLQSGTVASLLKEENKDKLVAILKYHVIAGKVTAAQAVAAKSAETLEGSSVAIQIKNGRLMINDSAVIGSDVNTSNGVIHIIDSVLLPPQPLTVESKIKEMIEFAIESGVDTFNDGNHTACTETYKMCLKSVALVGDKVLSSELMEEVNAVMKKVAKSNNARSDAWDLRAILDKVYDAVDNQVTQASTAPTSSQSEADSNFKVIVESKLPKGFPAPGPLNQVVVKDYPVYRAAKLESGMQNVAFMRLFGHIKKNNISMTAPVEMALDGSTGSRQDMAFLYGSTDIGKTGRAGGGVKVVDLPAKKYASLGMKGMETSQAVKKALKKLKSWVDDSGKYEVDGEPRLLGYNSPMVPSNKRFWEVQIPVKTK